MTKVFGIDRNVITPDNNNIEGNIYHCKTTWSGSSKFVQGSLNFRNNNGTYES